MKEQRHITLSVKKYKAGYEVREEIHETNFEAVPISGCDKEDELIKYINSHRGEHVIIKSAYTMDGHYIGNPRTARYIVVKRGIKPELSDPIHKVCSIGFCEKEQKWYGWSHRAIYGFGIGDVVSEGDCAASSGWTKEYLAEHPEDDTSLPVGFKAKDLVDAKRMAIAFANSVS